MDEGSIWDKIKEAFDATMDVDAQNEHQLLVPSNLLPKRVKVGELFGMEVIADPLCPKNEFRIERKK